MEEEEEKERGEGRGREGGKEGGGGKDHKPQDPQGFKKLSNPVSCFGE